MAEKTTKMSIKDLSIDELINFEKGALIVCQSYENSIRRYDNTIDGNSASYKEFESYNNLRTSIVDEIKRRLDNLK